MTDEPQDNEKRTFRPSDFLRERRPERYSDSIISEVPDLTKHQLEYHLDTLTNRNQEKEFEHFARKLAEKTLCPNLIPQTGPTGGGDSKVDTETYPVAESISNAWYQGNATASERWAFAFSAKKTWSTKVKSDVKKISETGRDYKLIYFATNQFVSDKKRANKEDKLANEFGIPVRILDRSWIIEQVFDHDCVDIVEKTLSIENLQSTPVKKIGPNDAKREAELEALDKDISNPERYNGVEYQKAEDILEGTRLACELERSRQEVDGRFAAALRVAESAGDPRQILRIYYRQAWNACFVYDDIKTLNKLYDKVEELALANEFADDAEYAVNLLNVLITSTATGIISPDISKIREKSGKLISHLKNLAGNDARPNNDAKAKGLLCLLTLTLVKIGYLKSIREDEILEEFNTLLKEADKLGEFPFESYKDLILELGEFFTDNDAYNRLHDTLVSSIEKRSSEGEAGAALIDRAIQLSSAGNIYEAIRILGRAQEKLIKDEYKFELVKSLLALGRTYDAAGLMWASRTCFLAVLSMTISDFHKSGYMHHFAYLAVEQLVFIELQIGRIPHALFAVSLANFIGMHAGINEDEFYDFIHHADAILTMLLFRLDKDQLEDMTKLTSRLVQLGLVCAECGLLFALGHLDRLREDVWFDENDTDERIEQFYQMICSQPADDDLPDEPDLGNRDTTTISSNILGCEFHISMKSNPVSLLIAESLLGALEAFLATSLNERIMPHRQEVQIVIELVGDTGEETCITIIDDDEADLLIQYDKNFDLDSKDKLLQFRDFIILLISRCLSRFTVVDDMENYMKKLAGEERCFSRALLFSDVLTLSDNVFGGMNWVDIRNWPGPEDIDYPLLRDILWRPLQEEKKEFTKAVERGEGDPPEGLSRRENMKHSDQRVLSVIDTLQWDKAKWQGTVYIHHPTIARPPAMGFLFKDEDAARKIFKGWNNRFGDADKKSEIKVVIITGINKNKPAHYRVFVGSNFENHIDGNEDTIFAMVSRIQTMTPGTTVNLDNFLKAYKHYKCYYLMPAILQDNDPSPKLLTDCYILKDILVVKQAWQVGDNDDEFLAIQPDDDPFIPSGEKNPPIRRTLDRMRKTEK